MLTLIHTDFCHQTAQDKVDIADVRLSRLKQQLETHGYTFLSWSRDQSVHEFGMSITFVRPTGEHITVSSLAHGKDPIAVFDVLNELSNQLTDEAAVFDPHPVRILRCVK